jgi:TusA-related sulfurtransferase
MSHEKEPVRPGFKVVSVTPAEIVDGGDLDAGNGLLLLLRNVVNRIEAGQVLELRSRIPKARGDIADWCRLNQVELIDVVDGGDSTVYLLRKGDRAARWDNPDWGTRLPAREGGTRTVRDWLLGRAGDIPEEASAYLGFVPRGAVAETGLPAYPFTINRKIDVWADNIADLYEQATSQQWNATKDIPWDRLPELPDDLEQAVCQIMTFLAENEYAALYVPAKFLPRINARFVEPILFLATIINDEARHIEAFTKRALANGGGLQYAAALTEWSLQSLLVQEDSFRSSFLLHVLGEGTFLDLLKFVEDFAPDQVTAGIVRRARMDEGRHVAYGIAHVREVLRSDPTKVDDLIAATEERAAMLQAASGSNPPVLNAMAVLAGHDSRPEQIRGGMREVRTLQRTMEEHRVRRMLQIGLDWGTATKISQLHTPNFM